MSILSYFSVILVGLTATVCQAEISIEVPPPENPLENLSAPSGATPEARAVKAVPLCLAVDLVDGSLIKGVPVITSIPFQTSYAKMDIPLKQIASIKIEDNHEAASFALRNGDAIKGIMDLGAIRLETLFGEATVGVEHVTRITVLLDNASGGLVVYYDFDGDDGGRVRDLSDNENHGRVVGPVTYVDGVSGKGIRITTPDAYVESLAQGLNMDGWAEVTVSVWFKLERQTTYGTILSRAAIGGKKGGTLSLAVGGSSACQGSFSCSGSGVTSSAFRKGHPPPLGKWHHMAATVGPRVIRLYVNGALDAEHVRERPHESISDNPTFAFTIGKYRAHRENWRDSYPHGVIDEVKVWQRALSESEIEHIYNAQQ
jgi:hypothetical protein